MPIGALVATSGVVAIILGLALQNTFDDVFSGIALTLGRPYVIGDWILLSDGTEGRVVESTWRSTHFLTAANNLVVLPNSFLAKLGAPVCWERSPGRSPPITGTAVGTW